MIIRKISLFCAVSIIGIFALSAFGQDAVFTDVNVDYSFTLPDAKWKITVKPSATSPNVEYVFGERRDCHLEVRKLTVANDAILSDVIKDEDRKQQFRPGYVAGKEEDFSGHFRGRIFNFEFVTAAANMAGRFYFLRADPTTVYLLRFTGQKDIIRTIRNQTDSIARTFTTVKPAS